MKTMKQIVAVGLVAFVVGSCGDDSPTPPTQSNTNNGECKPSAGGVEVCDGLDNNCDGNIDEGFDIGEECVVESGVCKGTGVYQCSSDGAKAVCSVEAPETSDEICDGIDNDCDGEIDEGFDVGAVCTAGVGECAVEATIQCGDDGTAICDAEPGTPGEESCDGLDNDCDGEVDEEFANLGDSCEVGVGACQTTGVIACSADGASAACDAVAGVPGTDDICDGLDNNCDGEVDEGWDELGDPCVDGLGVCAVAGTKICAEDGNGYACDAVAQAPLVADERTCDDLDNDCDGLVDEGCDDDLDGFCDKMFTNLGSAVCTRSGPDCDDDNAAVNPAATEVCDGIDNNCSGGVDDQATDATTYYVDCDGDTYAATGQQGVSGCAEPSAAAAMMACNNAAAAGWTTKAPLAGNTDCHDGDADFRPNQTAYFTAAGAPPSGSGFDYNCNGILDRFDSDVFYGNTNDPCPTITAYIDIERGGWSCGTYTAWMNTLPLCGASATYATCSGYTVEQHYACVDGTRTTQNKVQSCH